MSDTKPPVPMELLVLVSARAAALNVPSCIATAPVKVLATLLRVEVPVPFLVKVVPAPVITPVSVVSPAPAKTTSLPPPVIPPVRVSIWPAVVTSMVALFATIVIARLVEAVLPVY